jgi:hypothetical protein
MTPTRTRKAPLLLVPVLFLQGCLSTWMRMEDGTVLPPGRTEFALAYGMVPRTTHRCDEYLEKRRAGTSSLECVEHATYYKYDPETDLWLYDSTDRDVITPTTLSKETQPHFGLAWRLGALGPFGPFTGLEVGLQTEAPTTPISQEFHVALGLPGSNARQAHALIAGWGTGLWADNTWFVQYAASRTYGPCRVFGSLRGAAQATYITEILSEDKLQSARTWDVQMGSGVRVQLGKAPVAPDWLLLGMTMNLNHQGLPDVGGTTEVQTEGFGLAWTSAMGWSW